MCSLARNRFSLKIVALHTVLGGNWVLAQWFRLMGCEKQSNFVVVWSFSPEMKCDRKWKKDKKEEREEENKWNMEAFGSGVQRHRTLAQKR